VPAWSNNRLKSLVQARKRYVVDPALAAAATRMTPGAVLRDVDMLGRIFDTFGLAQLRPEAALMFPKPQIRHLRTRAGRQEVDLVIELSAGRVVGLEFKAELHRMRETLGICAGSPTRSGPTSQPAR